MDKDVFLGIDMSKGYANFIPLDIKGDPIEKCFQLTDNKEGRKQLSNLIKRWLSETKANIYCGVESTGGYENNGYYLLKGLQDQHNVFVSQLNPKVVKSTGDAKLRRTITDKVSAENIALYISKFKEDVNYGLEHEYNEEYKVGRDILTGIRMLIKQKTQLLNQLEKWLYDSFPEVLVFCKNGTPLWLLRLIETYPTAAAVSRSKGGILKIKEISVKKAEKLKLLANQNDKKVSLGKAHLLATTAKEIMHKYDLIDSQEKYLTNLYKDHEAVELLITIPGVGLKSAVTFVLEIDEVNRFDTAKKMASYFGVHPTFKESGDGRWGNHMSKRGTGTMRAALYMCAKTGVRYNEPL